MNISYSAPWVHMGTQIILLVVPAVPSKETLRLLCCCLHTPESHYFKHCVKVHLHPFTIFSMFYFLKHFGHMLSHKSRDHQLCKFCPSTVMPTGDCNIIFNLLNYYTKLYLKKNILRTCPLKWL